MPHKHGFSENMYSLFYKVRRKLAETTAGYWTDLEILSSLNQAQVDISVKSLCLKKNVTITTVASTATYDLRDESFADIINIDVDGVYFYQNGTTYVPLTHITKKRLNIEFPGWQGVSATTPTHYYYDKSSKTIGLYPKPNSTNAGAYLFVDGYYKPKTLLSGTASSGSTSTIVFAAGSTTVQYPSPTDDYYNNLYIEIYSGTGAGEKAKITDYVASTRTATASFTATIDNTSVFGMVPEIPEEAQPLMYLYAMADSLDKGGSRTRLSDRYWSRYFGDLAVFIGDTIEEPDEQIVKDTYR